MKITLFQVIRNESELLPYKISYCNENGFDLFSIDNESTDCSKTILKRHKGKYSYRKSGGLYSLNMNNNALSKAIIAEAPDWVVIAGADMFYYARGCRTFRALIEKADSTGYNAIDLSNLYEFYYTGNEKQQVDPRVEFHYYSFKNEYKIVLAFKYNKNEPFELNGERLVMDGIKEYISTEVVTLHYPLRADWRERKQEQLTRRMRAWEQGVDLWCWGKHYLELITRQEAHWDVGNLQDIRGTWIWKEYLETLA